MPETKDLILRKAVIEDWPDMLHNIWSRPESAKYMLWNLTTTEEAAIARMERTIAYQEAHAYHWTVVEKVSGQAIGWAGMEEISRGVWGETGIAIGPAFIRQGYGTQLLNCLTNYARDHLGAKRFVACCRPENQASKGTLRHCNFFFTHSEEAVHPRDGYTYTLDYYAKDLCSIDFYERLRAQLDHSSAVSFLFYDTDDLRDHEIFLRLNRTCQADPRRKWLPAYYFDICLLGGEKIGYCDLRIGHNEKTYIGGNIGYGIDEPYRGNHYAAKACKLLFNLAKKHGMEYLIITCDPANIPSAGTCKLAGGVFIEVANIPEDNEMYAEGKRTVNVYRFDMK